jgi:HSP20 family protein
MIFNKNNKITHPVETTPATIPEPAGWIDYEEPEIEGQLSIDVYQDKNRIVVKSTIAGVKPDDLKISLHHDLLTIKGLRSSSQDINEADYLYRECYWGSFSRSIILPTEVDSKKVEAELENGVLTITLYKLTPSPIDIKFKDE